MFLNILTEIINFINNIFDISSITSFLSGVDNAFNIVLPYIRGAFYILPVNVVIGCLSVVVVIYVVRVVMAFINIIYP